MSRPIFVVDAFADGPFRGNPAAVVLLESGDPVDDAWMQAVAAEMNHSETAYLWPVGDGEFDLRWF
ncbi:MAG TPA: PhzF family phenazine biosynthesis protein, partial [Acidimicrobiia bacterium]|nr:PhzF family phenazine biosynthesis protein [Acidimicrobiia bacterium]